MSLLRPTLIIGGFTLLSRVTGFVRDMLIAQFLGAGLFADCFVVAFKFPNLFRQFFAEGAFSAAFVPMFSAILTKSGKAAAQRFTNDVYTLQALVVLVFTIAMMLMMPWAMLVFAPGFSADPPKAALAVELTRITFPYLFFIAQCSLLSGVLNSVGKFAAAAGTMSILNVVLIAALFTLAPPLVSDHAHALAWGTEVAGVAQMVWLLWSAQRAGYLPRLVWPRPSPEVKTMLYRIVPVAFGAGLYQISILVDTMLASLLPSGSVSVLYYADRINQVPLGVVGIAVGTALLPLLSRQIASGDGDGAMESQNRAIETTLFLTLPAMAGIIVLAGPIITTFFQHGAFSAHDAAATTTTLIAFASGLPAYVLVKAFTPGFFAREDTKTPVRVAVAALVVNVSLTVLLMQVMGAAGIALATAIASAVNASTLCVLLVRRGHYRWDARLRQIVPRIVVAALTMAAALGLARWMTDPLLANTSTLVRCVVLAAEVILGGVIYFLAGWRLKAFALDDLKRLRRRG